VGHPMDVMFAAGEASGDLHSASLATALRTRRPDLSFVGVGGQRMRAAGVDLLADFASGAVMGFAEIITHIPRHFALLRSLTQRLRDGKVSLLVCVDYPGFNLNLAAEAHAARVPVLYYITPQVWAWGARRLKKLARVVTRAAVILPFEEELLRAHGIDATFVGHPLLDRAELMPDRANARAALGLAPNARVLALFPGSRAQEIERHLEPFLAAASAVERRAPGTTVLVSTAPGIHVDASRCPFPLTSADSLTVLRAADAALCKSGTTTLEAAVAGCPLVVGYLTSKWTYAIARRVVTIPRIGLVNVVAGREVAREFVQDALVPDSVADALLPLSSESPERARALAGLAEVRALLGTPGAAARVAEIADALVTEGGLGRGRGQA
jgi:lipid-A-disaccharide synthase